MNIQMPTIRYILSLFFIMTLSSINVLGAPGGDSKSPMMVSGYLKLLSNYVVRGLTYTTQDPSIQGGIGFHFGPQFRIAIGGSNVAFPNEKAHLDLTTSADLQVPISEGTSFILNYTQEKFFGNEDRDGSNTRIGFDYNKFKIRVDSLSNWEATNERAQYYNLTYVYTLENQSLLESSLGYILPKTDLVKPYMDLALFWKYKQNNIHWALGLSYTNTNAFERGGAQGVAGVETAF